MNVVFFSDTFLPQINGVVTYLIETGRELKKMGHNVLFVVPKVGHKQIPEGFSKQNFYFSPSLSADLLYPSWRLASTYSYSLDKVLSKFKPDVMHIHAPLTIGFGGIMAAKRFNKPLVGTYHTFVGSDEMLKIAGITKGKGTRVFKRVIWEYTNLFYNRCDVVLAPTAEMAEILKRNGVKSPITALHEGLRLSEFKMLDAHGQNLVRKRYRITGKKVVVFVGRISKEKNLILMINVFHEVVKRVPSSQLLIIGDGPQKDELIRLSDKLGLKDNIIFTGFIPHDKILSDGILSACDLFLTTSKFETFGLSALEAIGSGLPVVAVESQGVAELIEGNGLVSSDVKKDIAENVIKILTKDDLAKRFKERSLVVREKYAVEKTTGELVAIYESLIQEYSNKPPRKIYPSLPDLGKLLGF